MALPKTAAGAYNDIRRRFLPSLPESDRVTIRFVETGGAGDLIDTRDDEAGIIQDEAGNWNIEIDATIRAYPKWLYLVLAHECLHIIHPNAAHKSKEWNQAVRQLNGRGLLARIF